jgi:hypothetical protein
MRTSCDSTTMRALQQTRLLTALFSSCAPSPSCTASAPRHATRRPQRQHSEAAGAAETALELWRGVVRAGCSATSAAQALGAAAADMGGLTGAAVLLEGVLLGCSLVEAGY